MRASWLAALVGAALLGGGLACSSEADEPALEAESQPDPNTVARARLAAYEDERRGSARWAERPASDNRFGPDPYRLIALDERRVAVLLRGADELLIVDRDGERLGSAPTPPDPRDLVRSGGALLVVGTGAPLVARYELETLAPLEPLALPEAVAPRALAVDEDSVWVADEGLAQLHRARAEGVETSPHCRGPLALERVADLLLTTCLLEHQVRVDRVTASGLETLVSAIEHDGPIWSVELGPRTAEGQRLLALTGVEDHPLERRDGGFGYIDSFLWIYALDEVTGLVEAEPRASLNLSEQGIVTPKWSRWIDEGRGVVTAGYATPGLVELSWPRGFAEAPQIRERPGLPGTHDGLALGEGRWLATDPLLDRLVLLESEGVKSIPIHTGPDDDRSLDERVGELLVYTSAMAPWNSAEGKRSRFTCETCHFEGRGDGRVHFTGREFEGQPVHAVSKPLLGLFSNRPHFSRALDRSMAVMVDNEFGVANRHSGREPWFALGPATLAWLAEVEGWAAGEALDGEQLRRGLMAFLMRWSPAVNPAVRGRSEFSPLEAEGARLFARDCETCHQARLVADLAETRIGLEDPAQLEPWRERIFSDRGAIVWASEAYVQTGIRPWVHPEGARVPSLRRLYAKWPYFTNGGAESLEAVVAGVRLSPSFDHGLGQLGAGESGLEPGEREALVAFLRLL